MDYVVKEINGLEDVKKRKKTWFIWNKSVFLQPFKINILFNISIFLGEKAKLTEFIQSGVSIQLYLTLIGLYSSC